MSNDPRPVPESSATPREDADYEAVHAVLTATARGRKFLAEYVARRGRSDPRKLADSVAAFEAAMREGLASQASHAFARGLAELVAAIEQIGAELASDRSLAADGHFAVERIQDIAMALRQRDVEVALCDGLDAVIREVGDAVVRSDAAEARAHNAAGQLRELARQIADMTARGATARAADAAPSNYGVPRPLTDVSDEAAVVEDGATPPLDVGVHQPLPQTQAPSRSREDPAALPVPSPVQEGDEASQAAANSNAAVPQRAVLRDPLAALHTLSEEELVALFS